MRGLLVVLSEEDEGIDGGGDTGGGRRIVREEKRCEVLFGFSRSLRKKQKSLIAKVICEYNKEKELKHACFPVALVIGE
jgi:hypothetical protein